MLLFPQLLSGAIAQYPLRRCYAVSNITNLQEDGARYRSGGTNPAELQWTLTFTHLSQQESDALQAFFQKASGRAVPFTFLDPLSNLLSWSEDLSQPIWAKSPFLNTSSIIADGYTGFQLTGSIGSAGQIAQSLPCPAAALVCLSVFARTDQAAQLTLSIDSVSQTFPLTDKWNRYYLTESGTVAAETKFVTISSEEGRAQISRLTVSAQPAPATYTVTQEKSGILPQTRFDQDSLAIHAIGVDDFACSVRLTTRF